MLTSRVASPFRATAVSYCLRALTRSTRLSTAPRSIPRSHQLLLSTSPSMSWTTSVTKSGHYERKSSGFREWISSKSGAQYPPEAHRYHLYISLACPWASRTAILRSMKGLESVIGMTCVDWYLDKSTGWTFTDAKDKCELDPVNGFTRLRQVYELMDKEYSGNITVPVLFDTRTNTIVNNESSEIIRMLNSEFNQFCATPAQAAIDLYPESLRAKIDAINEPIYTNVNNGVYKSGFAQSQAAYEENVSKLFAELDHLEELLAKQRYLVSNEKLTEADIRLFTTLVRFDPVYHGHFKCNIRQLREYPNLWNYMLELYQLPSIRPTVNLHHCKNHYYQSHQHINPTRIVPVGPAEDLDAPHDRHAKFPIAQSPL